MVNWRNLKDYRDLDEARDLDEDRDLDGRDFDEARDLDEDRDFDGRDFDGRDFDVSPRWPVWRFFAVCLSHRCEGMLVRIFFSG